MPHQIYNDKINTMELCQAALDRLPEVFKSTVSVIAKTLGYAAMDELNFWIYRELARHFMRTNGPYFPALTFPAPFPLSIFNLITGSSSSSQRGEAAYPLFAHPADGDNEKVAFTPNAEYGRADRQVVVSMGKFLKSKCPHTTELSDPQIAAFANQFVISQRPPKLHITQDADEIIRVYNNGPSSCMTKFSAGQQHPAAVYAGPYTAVAYMVDPTEPTRITARTVLVRKKETDAWQWVRLYGNEAAIRAALQQQGISQISSMEGVRLKRIVPEPSPILRGADHEAHVLLPYIDHSSYAYIEGDDIVLSNNQNHRAVYVNPKVTNGFSVRSDSVNCSDCGGIHAPENTFRVDGRVYCRADLIQRIAGSHIIEVFESPDLPAVVKRDCPDYTYLEALDIFVVKANVEAFGYAFIEGNDKAVPMDDEHFPVCPVRGTRVPAAHMITVDGIRQSLFPQLDKVYLKASGEITMKKPRTSKKQPITLAEAVAQLREHVIGPVIEAEVALFTPSVPSHLRSIITRSLNIAS